MAEIRLDNKVRVYEHPVLDLNSVVQNNINNLLLGVLKSLRHDHPWLCSIFMSHDDPLVVKEVDLNSDRLASWEHQHLRKLRLFLKYNFMKILWLFCLHFQVTGRLKPWSRLKLDFDGWGVAWNIVGVEASRVVNEGCVSFGFEADGAVSDGSTLDAGVIVLEEVRS